MSDSVSTHLVTVALVGREELGDENLALRYLASALQQRTSAATALIMALRQDLQPFWAQLDQI